MVQPGSDSKFSLSSGVLPEPAFSISRNSPEAGIVVQNRPRALTAPAQLDLNVILTNF